MAQTSTQELTRAGDQMQSALSRISEWVGEHRFDEVPYEVRMALLEGEDAIRDWTDARTAK